MPMGRRPLARAWMVWEGLELAKSGLEVVALVTEATRE
jgi:hypothetical protein